GCQEKKIVPGQHGAMRPEPLRQQDLAEHDRAEEAGPPLLEHKEKELPCKCIQPARRNVILEPDANLMEAGFGRAEQGGRSATAYPAAVATMRATAANPRAAYGSKPKIATPVGVPTKTSPLISSGVANLLPLPNWSRLPAWLLL